MRPRGGGSIGIVVVSGLTGACTMTLELSAVRMLAPWYGTSVTVWTNVIGVILLALSIGYLLGARLSTGGQPEKALGACLLLGALSVVWLPALAAPVAGWFLPRGLALDEAAAVLGWGSLASALILFLPTPLLLGCVPPLATEIVQRRDSSAAGNAGGRILAASTVGSILGTFGTSYVALPVLGLTRTYLSSGAVLLVLAGIVLVGRSRASAWMIAPLAGALLAFGASRMRAPEAPAGWRLLESVESPYQSVRVVEEQDVAPGMRRLQVNEGFDSFQSVWQSRTGFLPDGYYYNLFALPAWWSRRAGTWSVMTLGLGAGTTWRVLQGALPASLDVRSTGVEIDPRVVEMGARWFELPLDDPQRTVVAGWDARTALRQVATRYDQIVLDAYANQMEIPPHLCTREFFVEIRAHLETGGWLCVNIGGFGLTDPVVESVSGTAARAFERRALALRVPFSRNCVLLARAGADVPDPAGREWYTGNIDVDPRLAALALEGAYRWFEPTEITPLTDDHNAIDRLQRRSIAEGRERWLGSR